MTKISHRVLNAGNEKHCQESWVVFQTEKKNTKFFNLILKIIFNTVFQRLRILMRSLNAVEHVLTAIFIAVHDRVLKKYLEWIS